MTLHFKEKQKFTQWWLWALLVGGALVPAYGVYRQVILGKQFGNNSLPDFGLILFLFFMIAILGFFWMMQLATEINEHSIKVRFQPFTSKNIKWEDVTSAEVVKYGFVGGWGIRTGTKYGTVYNTGGTTGLAIVLKNGTKLCIGTQQEHEVKKVLEEARRLQKL